MGDIVDRLRNSIGNVLLEREAAWEIESLRTQLSAATAALEAAQKDAERFQWWFIKRNRLYMFGASDRHDPDAAIDAAQREGGGE